MFEKDMVSVIIPVYNVEDYLERCLTSVVNNSYTNLQIICVDDGSSDNSGRIIDHYANADERVIAIHVENGGISRARNIGMDLAKGEFISFIDSDDWVQKDFFLNLVNALREHNADYAMCDFIRAYDEMKDFPGDSGKTSRTITMEMVMSDKKYRIYVWRTLYRHDVIANIRFRTIVLEDGGFGYDLYMAKNNIKVAYVDYAMYAYYQRTGSLVSFIKPMDYFEWCSTYIPSLKLCESKTADYISRDIIKTLLSTKYIMLIIKNTENARVIQRSLKTCLPYLKKDRLLLSMMVYLPWLYRLFRISTDKTLLEYEKKIKAGIIHIT